MSNDYPSYNSDSTANSSFSEASDSTSQTEVPSFAPPPYSPPTYESMQKPEPEATIPPPPAVPGASLPAYHPTPPPAGTYYPPAVASNNDVNLIVLLAGIGGIMIPFISFVAWFLGSRERKALKAQGKPEDPMLTIGWILGIAMSALHLLFFAFMLLMVIWMLIAMVAGAASY